ncbi:MAG: hypothetical protein HQ517_13420 [SAR324 cluster bacterium]|nr:hypothetical protein [SAR324 cluster bacterium]
MSDIDRIRKAISDRPVSISISDFMVYLGEKGIGDPVVFGLDEGELPQDEEPTED